MLLKILLISIYLLQSIFSDKCSCIISKNDNIVDFQNTIEEYTGTCDSIIIDSGSYIVDEPIIIKKSTNIIGLNNPTIIFNPKDKFKRTKPSGLFQINQGIDLKIENINFNGTNGYVVSHFYNDISKSKNSGTLIITKNIISGLGLIWISPKNGFTYNFMDDRDYYYSGNIRESNFFSEIYIANNKLDGGYTFNDELKKKSSGIALLYCSNITIKDNSIKNYRFGIWIYGGSSFDKKKLSFPDNPILSKNILISNNTIKNTYSSIFLSRSANIVIQNNECENNLDVSIDLEGCDTAYVQFNKSYNSRGGSLTPLNNSKNIWFNYNNVINQQSSSDDKNRVVFIRNNNNEILYSNNRFEYIGDNEGEIRIDNSMLSNREHNIKFVNNKFINVKVVNVK